MEVLIMKMNDHQKQMTELLEKAASDRGWKVVTNHYGNLRNPKIMFECSRGHRFKLAPRSMLYERPVCLECRKHDFREEKFKEIQRLASSAGYECISDISEFKNERSVLWFKCPVGHEWKWQARAVFNGSPCPDCKRTALEEEMQRKFEAKIHEQGGRLIPGRYMGSRLTHEVECAQGHRFWNSPSNIMRGQWCPYCKGLAPKTIEEIRQFAESLGWKLLSKEYVNNRQKLVWQCDKGHIFQATWANIQHRRRCPLCSNSRPYTIDEMKQIASEHDGECLSEECTTGRSRVNMRCKEGHEWHPRAEVIRRGHWCRKCRAKEAGIRSRIEESVVKQLVEERGGSVLSIVHEGGKKYVLYRCQEGHLNKGLYTNLKKGTWCDRCSSGLGERICRAFFEVVFGKEFNKARPAWLRSDKGRLMELDGYCHELDIAFEYNGIQHYALGTRYIRDERKLQKRKEKDARKVELCQERGIRLFVIPEITGGPIIDKLKDVVREQSSVFGIELPDDYFSRQIDLRAAYTSREREILDELKTIAKKSGFEILEDLYMGSSEKLRCRCYKQGHDFSIAPAKIKAGQGCKKCGRQKVAAVLKSSIEDILALARAFNLTLLSAEYQNMHEPLLWRCNVCGQEFRKKPAAFKYGGKACPACN